MLQLARRDCAALVADGTFADTDQHDKTVRSDQICWISDNEGDLWARATRFIHSQPRQPGLLATLRVLRSMAAEIQRGGGFPSDDLGVPRSGQLARYTAASRIVIPPPDGAGVVAHDGAGVAHLAARGEAEEDARRSTAAVRATGGARYTAHRDGLPLTSASLPLLLTNPGVAMREVTAIVYLTASNGVWPEDEPTHRIVESVGALRPGSLVLYLGADPDDTTGATAHTIVEILPIGGRAVLFDSRRILHEVRPNTRTDLERLAMTCWIGGAYDLAGLAGMMVRAWRGE